MIFVIKNVYKHVATKMVLYDLQPPRRGPVLRVTWVVAMFFAFSIFACAFLFDLLVFRALTAMRSE